MFGQEWTKLHPEILVPLFHLGDLLPEDRKLVVMDNRPLRKERSWGDGLGVDFTITSRLQSLKANLGIIEAFLRRHSMADFFSIGIYLLHGNKGFHLRASADGSVMPRKWGMTEGGKLIEWEEVLKIIGASYSV